MYRISLKDVDLCGKVNSVGARGCRKRGKLCSERCILNTKNGRAGGPGKRHRSQTFKHLKLHNKQVYKQCPRKFQQKITYFRILFIKKASLCPLARRQQEFQSRKSISYTDAGWRRKNALWMVSYLGSKFKIHCKVKIQ